MITQGEFDRLALRVAKLETALSALTVTIGDHETQHGALVGLTDRVTTSVTEALKLVRDVVNDLGALNRRVAMLEAVAPPAAG